MNEISVLVSARARIFNTATSIDFDSNLFAQSFGRVRIFCMRTFSSVGNGSRASMHCLLLTTTKYQQRQEKLYINKLLGTCEYLRICPAQLLFLSFGRQL